MISSKLLRNCFLKGRISSSYSWLARNDSPAQNVFLCKNKTRSRAGRSKDMSLQHILSSDNLSFLIPLVFYTSFFLTIGALALFIEFAIVLRTLVLGRSRLAHYALIGLPLGASILCYIVSM